MDERQKAAALAAYMRHADMLRGAFLALRATVENIAEPELLWPVPGYDLQSTLDTLADLTPPDRAVLERRFEEFLR